MVNSNSAERKHGLSSPVPESNPAVADHELALNAEDVASILAIGRLPVESAAAIDLVKVNQHAPDTHVIPEELIMTITVQEDMNKTRPAIKPASPTRSPSRPRRPQPKPRRTQPIFPRTPRSPRRPSPPAPEEPRRHRH